MRIPVKLKRGDEIRIIAPSRSASILSEEGVHSAKERLENLGFVVSFTMFTFPLGGEVQVDASKGSLKLFEF